jgi:2,5-diamino-6-(ribosylamino)-4(3H)-pyrimidinone 5'-phosphate reductase
MHNSISLDGSLTDFQPNMALHYQIAGSFEADAHLIGSNTAKVGVTLYSNGIPNEEKDDFVKPKRDSNLPYWVMIDSKGVLNGILHICRRFEYSRDVVVMISEQTPKEYIEYLKQRNYDYHIAGKSRVELKKALEILSTQYAVKTVLTDTGRILDDLLLNQSLVSQISLLIHPIIVGKKTYPMFTEVAKTINLTLEKEELLEKGYVWLLYKVQS